MNRGFYRVVASLLTVCIIPGAAAQTCVDNIPATTPDSRFRDNGDGTVSDAATGLMWKQCVEGLGGVNCITGSAVKFTWQQALQQADVEFTGHGDWRLANIKELSLLVERRCYDPAINTRFFPNTPSSEHWSSSPFDDVSSYAWDVYFRTGNVNIFPKNQTAYVRLVRGGQ